MTREQRKKRWKEEERERELFLLLFYCLSLWPFIFRANGGDGFKMGKRRRMLIVKDITIITVTWRWNYVYLFCLVWEVMWWKYVFFCFSSFSASPRLLVVSYLMGYIVFFFPTEQLNKHYCEKQFDTISAIGQNLLTFRNRVHQELLTIREGNLNCKFFTQCAHIANIYTILHDGSLDTCFFLFVKMWHFSCLLLITIFLAEVDKQYQTLDKKKYILQQHSFKIFGLSDNSSYRKF